MRVWAKARAGRLPVLIVVVALAGCTSSPTVSGEAAEPSTASLAPSPDARADAFPIAAFADLDDDEPVSEATAAEYQAALEQMADGTGMQATVMSSDGIWTGTTGTADGVRDITADDQFGIASVTKSIAAAQVMQMVEAGELDLDDSIDEYLPADLDFDTNGATIRQLLGMHAGIPDFYDDDVKEDFSSDPGRPWTPSEALERVDEARARVGDEFLYSDTNYVLLGLAIEHIEGRPVGDVLRDGVLDGIDGIDRLVYQPDEAPTEPIAMPWGESRRTLADAGGFLPSIADVTSAGPAGAIASNSSSLAHWWRAFCAGEIVSQDSLTEMTTFDDGYGLGVYDPGQPYANVVGHTGENLGYVAWAGCLPEDGAVVVVLANDVVDDIGGMAEPLVEAVVA